MKFIGGGGSDIFIPLGVGLDVTGDTDCSLTVYVDVLGVQVQVKLVDI